MSTPQKPDWLSISAYARLYTVNRRTVRKWMAQGLLAHWKHDRIIRVQNTPPSHFSCQEKSA